MSPPLWAGQGRTPQSKRPGELSCLMGISVFYVQNEAPECFSFPHVFPETLPTPVPNIIKWCHCPVCVEQAKILIRSSEDLALWMHFSSVFGDMRCWRWVPFQHFLACGLRVCPGVLMAGLRKLVSGDTFKESKGCKKSVKIMIIYIKNKSSG